jgi:hypothetical protein
MAGCRREWEAAAAVGADRRGRQHSAAGAVLNRFKPVQTDSNLPKFWLIQKVPFCAQQIGNKIWLERGWDDEQLCLKNFLQIRKGFGTKIQKTSMCWI